MRAAGGHSGAWVYDLKAGKTLYKNQANKRRILASNTKLFTTTAVLGRYGAGHQFKTRIWLRGERRGPGKRTLHGSVDLVGAGDPALASSSFARDNGLPVTRLGILAARVKHEGIRKIQGNIVADPSVFDGHRSIPQPGISGGPFLGPLSGLSYDSGFDSGHYAKNPPRQAGLALRHSLQKQGIKVTGAVRVGRVPGKVTKHKRFAAVSSPKLSSLLAATNKPSNNFFAEMLLKLLDAGGKHSASTKDGARKAEKFAHHLGSGIKMVNGSGLSRVNKSAPEEVGRLLVGIKRSKRLRVALPASLSIAGKDGTLASRMRGTAAEGRCRGKTGTLDGVSALSGYCKRNGRTIAFSILMNNVDIAAAQHAQDGMVSAIARYSK